MENPATWGDAERIGMGAQLDELVAAAVDLMSSQQAMPDDGALRELAVIVREAYALGQESREATQ